MAPSSSIAAVILSSGLQGRAGLNSPGLGSALQGSGSGKLRARPWLKAQAGLGLGSGLSPGFRVRIDQGQARGTK